MLFDWEIFQILLLSIEVSATAKIISLIEDGTIGRQVPVEAAGKLVIGGGCVSGPRLADQGASRGRRVETFLQELPQSR